MRPVVSITFAMFCRCRSVMKSWSLKSGRSGRTSVRTIAKPAKTAPATKYGGKTVVCHPGTMPTAKSNETMEWTERTSGVESPARRSEATS